MKLHTWILGTIAMMIFANIVVPWVLSGELVINRGLKFYLICILIGGIVGAISYKIIDYGNKKNEK